MHRPLIVRVVSLALSFWLPLFMGGADAVVRCPTHGGGTMVGAHSVGQSQGAEHSHGLTDSAPAHHESQHQCSCPGPSCCPPAVAVVPVVSIPMAHVVAVHEARAVSTLDLFSSDRDYLLPFATAPPAAALAPAAAHIV